MALMTKIFIFLFKKNYHLAQSYIITQGIGHLGIIFQLRHERRVLLAKDKISSM
jgi:hypothetical protein